MSEETWQMRVVAEHKQLRARYEGLTKYMGTEAFDGLPIEDREDLVLQHAHMEGYLRYLERRMERHGLSTHPDANIHGLGPDVG